MKNDDKKIVVGLSGGVDSAVALILLKEAGYNPIGLSLILPVWEKNPNCENSCCTDESLCIAREVCEKLKIEYYQYDEKEEFKKEVVDYFKNTLKMGKTPNPCIVCNRFSKFAALSKWADEHGIYHISTGHYARVVKNESTDKYELKLPKDLKKDQTYTLAYLTQQQISRLILPLGEFYKSEIMDIANAHGFDFFRKKKESQNFCFVANKAMDKFIEEVIKPAPGKIRDENGKYLGEHKGLSYYTIGQRKGLGFSTKYYVMDKDIEKNELILTENSSCISKNIAHLIKVSFISNNEPEYPIKIKVKTRYQQSFNDAILVKLSKDLWELNFLSPQSSVTPGQFAVFYDGDSCLGAGEISLY